MVKQNRNVMSFVDVLAHSCILRRRAARNRPAGIEVSPEIGVELEIVQAALIVSPEVAVELEITVTEGGGGGS
jgi:hypothetical protein